MVAMFEALPCVEHDVLVHRPKFECRLPDVFFGRQRRAVARNGGLLEAVELGQRAKLKGIQVRKAQFVLQVMFGRIGMSEADRGGCAWSAVLVALDNAPGRTV